MENRFYNVEGMTNKEQSVLELGNDEQAVRVENFSFLLNPLTYIILD